MTGPAADRDTFTAPDTKVVKSFEVGAGNAGPVVLTYDLGRVDRPVLRAAARHRRQPHRARLPRRGVDPAGPAIDVLGDADPWDDLWFYTNPIWVLPTDR